MGEFDDVDDDARRDASSEGSRHSPSSNASTGPGPSSSGSAADPDNGPASHPAAAPDNDPTSDPASDADPASDPASDPAAPARPAREWRVRARRELTEELILEEVGGIEGKNAGRVLALHSLMREEAQLHARRLRHLADFFAIDPDNEGSLTDADMTAMKVAVGLRCSITQATSQIRDAHHAVVNLPRMFAHLEAGDLPEDYHRFLLRQVRRLDADQIRLVDEHLAGVEIPSIPRSTFEAQVRLAVASVGNELKPPREAREVRIDGVDSEQGVAWITITGPISEIRSLGLRLDASARAVQRAQRVALEAGEEEPIPFDLDGDVRDRERPLSLSALRYAILTRTMLDLDPVEETAQPFKILVTVPVTTLLGMDDSPAMLDGLTPIPADLARDLAATSSVWYRILTDPVCGTHLPARIDTYRPDAQQRMQLRLRHPVCAAPGCTRPTALAAEDDHIIEYDHHDPARGGPTSLWNLHRLCRRHHQLKTAGLIDPARDPQDDPDRGDRSTSAEPLVTTWQLEQDLRVRTAENTDLLTPRMTRRLAQAERTHRRAREARQRGPDEPRCRALDEAEDHLAEIQLEDEFTRVRTKRRIIPPGPPLDVDHPPF